MADIRVTQIIIQIPTRWLNAPSQELLESVTRVFIAQAVEWARKQRRSFPEEQRRTLLDRLLFALIYSEIWIEEKSL